MPKKPEAKIQKTSSARPVKRTPARTAKAAKSAAPKAAAKSSPKASPARAGTKAPRAQSSQAVTQLVDALKGHPQQKDLVTAGQQQKDQLLRSLIPLYLARALNLEVTSGTTSRFWGTFGVSYAAPNAAKALRMNTGYAQETRKGKAITSKGVRYVEQALKQIRPN